MEVMLGKTAGFCYGVKRAVDGCINELKDTKDTYCLGEIVHNRQVIEDLNEKGIKFINSINEAPTNSKVIIRAHGIPKEVYEDAKERNIKVVDYTCPNVLKVHEIAEEYSNNGYFIFLTCSKKTHPEVIGIQSFCGESYILIEKIEDVEEALQKFYKSSLKKLLLISQTTYSMKKFDEIKKKINEQVEGKKEFVVKNTICYATQARQDETEKLSTVVDKMIIIGGKNSSNTQKLYEVAEKNCQNAVGIETKGELAKEDFVKINKVGIMAGASTPSNIIKEVKEYVQIL